MAERSVQKGGTYSPTEAYLVGLKSKQSKKTMRASLRAVCGTLYGLDPRAEIGSDERREFDERWTGFTSEPFWFQMDAQKVDLIRSKLMRDYAPRSAAKHFAAVKGVLKKYLMYPKLADTPKRFVKLQQAFMVEAVNGAAPEVGRRLKPDEIERLAQVCREDQNIAAGSRDDAMIGLGVTQGPRITEFSDMRLGDYDPKTGDIIIRSGKGGKTRTVRSANGQKKALDAYLEMRGSKPGPLFCRIVKDGTTEIVVDHLSTNAIGTMLKKRADQAGVARFTCHDLRRTFITNGWAAGIPGPQIQEIAGHSSIATTAGYNRGDQEEALRNTSGRLDYPSGWGSN